MTSLETDIDGGPHGEPGPLEDETTDTDEGSRPAEPPAVPPVVAAPPAPVSVGVSLLRHPLLFILVAVLVTVLVVGVAASSASTYSSEARILVGQIDTEARAIPGFVAATQDLASVYARVAETDAVLAPASEAAAVPLGELRRAVRASPIPDASIIRIEAESADERLATRMAQATADSLSAYVQELTTADPYDSDLYREYEAATTELAAAIVAQRSLQSDLDALRTPQAREDGLDDPVVIEELNAALTAATARAMQLEFRADQLASQFQAATRGTGDTAEARVIAPAAPQGSDRAATLQVAAVVGIAAGVLLALGIVVLVSNLAYLRAVRRRTEARS